MVRIDAIYQNSPLSLFHMNFIKISAQIVQFHVIIINNILNNRISNYSMLTPKVTTTLVRGRFLA